MVCCSSIASCIDKIPSIGGLNPESGFTSQWLTLKRSTIRYITRGDPHAKDTVILMPDPPNTIENMQELITILEKKFRVIAFEGVGFGYSTANLSYDYSIEHNAEVIIEMLEKLAVKRAILALTCIAALPGLYVANKHPNIISGLVLGQVPYVDEAKIWAKRVDFKGVLATPFLGQILLRMIRSRAVDLWYKNALPKGQSRSLYTNQAANSFKRGAKFSLASAFQKFQLDKTPVSQFIAHQPAIVLWGSLDRTHKKTNKAKTLDLLPNGKMIELEECGHFPDLEMPIAFAKAINDVSIA
jgi:pimeloyl-ACP methyl ester carboxylesterase